MEFEEHVELTVVREAGTEAAAAMVIGRLEAEGIRAVANPPLGTPGGRSWMQRVVLVRSADVDRAREVLVAEL
jgi:hypothetical protein